MIKPFTAICMLAAGATGLFLYQSKHRAAMLDKQIMGVLRQTDATRERIAALRADWSRLNEQEWLAELSSKHLGLRKLAPTQFTSLADLGSRLPPPLPAGTLVASNDEAPAASVATQPTLGAVPPPAPAASAVAAVPAAPAAPAPARMAARPVQPPVPTQTGSGQVAAAQAAAAPASAGPVVPASAAPRAARPARPEGRDEAAAAPAVPVRAAQAALPRAPVVSVAAPPIHVAATPPVDVARSAVRAVPQPAWTPAPAYAAQTVAAPGGYAQVPAVQSALGQSALGGARPSLPPPVPYGAQPR